MFIIDSQHWMEHVDGKDGPSHLHGAVSPAEALGTPPINADSNLLVFRSESTAPFFSACWEML